MYFEQISNALGFFIISDVLYAIKTRECKSEVNTEPLTMNSLMKHTEVTHWGIHPPGKLTHPCP